MRPNHWTLVSVDTVSELYFRLGPSWCFGKTRVEICHRLSYTPHLSETKTKRLRRKYSYRAARGWKREVEVSQTLLVTPSFSSRCILRFLAGLCWEEGIKCFKMRPKHHCIWHVARDVKMNRLNPRVFHCFGDEAFLGKIKYVARQCHGKSMERRILQRYALGLATFFHKAKMWKLIILVIIKTFAWAPQPQKHQLCSCTLHLMASKKNGIDCFVDFLGVRWHQKKSDVCSLQLGIFNQPRTAELMQRHGSNQGEVKSLSCYNL